jgi:hypothetical protein
VRRTDRAWASAGTWTTTTSTRRSTLARRTSAATAGRRRTAGHGSRRGIGCEASARLPLALEPGGEVPAGQ